MNVFQASGFDSLKNLTAFSEQIKTWITPSTPGLGTWDVLKQHGHRQHSVTKAF